MNTLAEILVALGQVLLLPVIVALWLAFAFMLATLGGFTRELVDRGRDARIPGLAAAIVTLPDETAAAAWLRGHEHRWMGRVERLQRVARLAPLLGLAGTLVPLGPALQAFAAGDVQQLAGQLVLAFGTTVLGLVVAAPCAWIASVRRRWYEADLDRLETAWATRGAAEVAA